MRTILVATDFSIAALKALQYALDLALKSKARLLVCHIYQIPLPYSGDPEYTDREFRRVSTEKMAEYLEGVDGATRAVVGLEILLREGKVGKQLAQVITEREIALVVMGTTGAGEFRQRLLGSTTEWLLQQELCPVLAIPARASLQPVNRLVYATDFENPADITLLQLLPLQELFGAALTLLHVRQPAHPERLTAAAIQQALTRHFPRHTLEVVQVESEAVAEGIAHYVKTHHTSLLAFTILHRPLWESLFHRSVTHQLLHHLNLPMLALPQTGRLLDLRNHSARPADNAKGWAGNWSYY